jgi:hypothetical protein
MNGILKRTGGAMALLAAGIMLALPTVHASAQGAPGCYGFDLRLGLTELTVNGQGSAAAWALLPPEFRPGIDQFGGNANTATPVNLFAQTENGRPVQIAGQPQNPSFLNGQTPDNAAVYGNPAFSPDGARVAFSSYQWGPEGASQNQIISIHDLATSTVTPIFEVPFQLAEAATPVTLQWGPPGILFYSHHAYPEDFVPERQLIVVDAATGQITFAWDDEVYGPDRAITAYFWVETDADWQIAVILNTFERFMIDPQTGSITDIRDRTLEWYSPRAEASPGFALVLDDAGTGEFPYTWAKLDASGGLTNTPYVADFLVCPPLLSADGQSMLWLDASQGFVRWSQGQTAPAGFGLNEPGVSALLAGDWGWGQWRLAAAGNVSAPPASDAYAFAITCPGFMPSRMVLGATGYVTIGGGANNLRAQPTRSGDLLAQIPEGGAFTVVEGPTCAEDMAWWRVTYNGVTGWTAEGQGSVYWLTPTL